MYLTLGNNFFRSCGTRFTLILMVRATRFATSRTTQIISTRKVRSEGRASPSVGLYKLFPDDPIASAWVGGAEKEELVIDLVVMKGPEL